MPSSMPRRVNDFFSLSTCSMSVQHVHFSLLTSLLNFATVWRIQFHPALSLCRPQALIALRYVNLAGLDCGGVRGCGHVGQHACCPANALRLGQGVKNAPQRRMLRPCPVDRAVGTLHNGRKLCMTRSNLVCLSSLSSCVDRCASNEFS